MYREKHRCYPAPVGQLAALDEEGLALTDPVAGEDSESKVEAVGGLNVCLVQAMSRYQRGATVFRVWSPGHFARGCPHREAFRQWHCEQANSKGAGESSPLALGSAKTRPEVNVHVIGWI